MARLPLGVRKRAAGGFEKRFTVEGERFSVYGGSLKELEDKEQEVKEKLRLKLQTRRAKVTLDLFYEEWQEGRTRTVKASTQYTQNRQFKHISESLGKMRVQDIEPADVKAFQRALLQKKDKNGNALLSTHGVNLIMSLLKSILNDAVRERVISWNPCDTIKALKPAEDEEDATDGIHRALTLEETETFFNYSSGSFYNAFFQFLLATGMRSGEAAALQWKDVDYINGLIHITKTVTRVSDSEVKIGPPKTRGSRRDIPLTDTVKGILQLQKENQRALLPQLKSIENRIFTTTNGGIIRTTSISAVIKHIIKRANRSGEALEIFAAHAFRDTYATRAIESGMHPRTLQEILGHTSFKMTMDKYAQVTTATMKEQAEKVAVGF